MQITATCSYGSRAKYRSFTVFSVLFSSLLSIKFRNESLLLCSIHAMDLNLQDITLYQNVFIRSIPVKRHSNDYTIFVHQ